MNFKQLLKSTIAISLLATNVLHAQEVKTRADLENSLQDTAKRIENLANKQIELQNKTTSLKEYSDATGYKLWVDSQPFVTYGGVALAALISSPAIKDLREDKKLTADIRSDILNNDGEQKALFDATTSTLRALSDDDIKALASKMMEAKQLDISMVRANVTLAIAKLNVADDSEEIRYLKSELAQHERKLNEFKSAVIDDGLSIREALIKWANSDIYEAFRLGCLYPALSENQLMAVASQHFENFEKKVIPKEMKKLNLQKRASFHILAGAAIAVALVYNEVSDTDAKWISAQTETGVTPEQIAELLNIGVKKTDAALIKAQLEENQIKLELAKVIQSERK